MKSKKVAKLIQKNQRILLNKLEKDFRKAERNWQREILQKLRKSGATMLPEVKEEDGYSISLEEKLVHPLAGVIAARGYRIRGVDPVTISREFRLP